VIFACKAIKWSWNFIAIQARFANSHANFQKDIYLNKLVVFERKYLGI
jgi:hypothetical protein